MIYGLRVVPYNLLVVSYTWKTELVSQSCTCPYEHMSHVLGWASQTLVPKHAFVNTPSVLVYVIRF
jgi:hypothetical protein